MHNLNLIKGKHQTNLDEGLSTKRLAWNLLAVSSEAGGGGVGWGGVGMSSQHWGREGWCGQSSCGSHRGGVGVTGDGDATRGKGTLNQRAWGQLCHQQEARPLPPWLPAPSSRIADAALRGTFCELRETSW